MEKITEFEDGNDLIKYIVNFNGGNYQKQAGDEIVSQIKAIEKNRQQWRLAAVKRKEQADEGKKGKRIQARIHYSEKIRTIYYQISTNVPSNVRVVDFIEMYEDMTHLDFLKEYPELEAYLPKRKTKKQLWDECIRCGKSLVDVFPIIKSYVPDYYRYKNNGELLKIHTDLCERVTEESENILSLYKAFPRDGSWVIELRYIY